LLTAKPVMYPGLSRIPMDEPPERMLADLRAFVGDAGGREAGSDRETGSG
jgi:hypothetical protein